MPPVRREVGLPAVAQGPRRPEEAYQHEADYAGEG